MSEQRGLRIGMISLGCAKNLVDSEVMLGHLGRAGHVFVRDPAVAEVLVINTCGFIEPAREESIQTILEAAELKKSGSLKRLVVAGCMVQRYAERLMRELPEVDAFIGLDQLDRIVEQVAGELPPEPDPRESWGRSVYLYDEHAPRQLATGRFSAYVKIAEGCDHSCAFCAIPGFRGGFRSRRVGSVLAEVDALVRGGVREVNLIAQDSSHFGRDRGERDALPRLLEGLDEIDGLRWIRLHYLYPNSVTAELIETMARLGRVVKYVDMPLQHADPGVLARMRRGGGAEGHRRLIERFRRAMPEAAIRSTFIVGFPGETEHEFETLLEFVEATRLDHLGVFRYSHEEDTPAFALEDDVPAATKNRRYARLMELQRRIVAERNRAMIGRRVEVLVEGAHPETEHLLAGRMSTQAPDVDGRILINDGRAEPGEFVEVELTETAGYDLVGAIVGGR